MSNRLILLHPHQMAEQNLHTITNTLLEILPLQVNPPVQALPVNGDVQSVTDKLIELFNTNLPERLYICPILIDSDTVNNILKQIKNHTGEKEIILLQNHSKEIINHLKRKPLSPEEIEKKSFEIIVNDPAGQTLKDTPSEKKAIITRVVHATGDFEFIKTLTFHPLAIQHALRMIKEGKDILTDIEMVRTGINKGLLDRFGIKAICGLGSYNNLKNSLHETRSEIAIERALKENNNIGIIAIGNAPTALLKVIHIFSDNKNNLDTPLIIGVPVGFVKAVESKVLLSMQSYPYITNLSRKGGTSVAVAIVNALLKIAGKENSDPDI